MTPRSRRWLLGGPILALLAVLLGGGIATAERGLRILVGQWQYERGSWVATLTVESVTAEGSVSLVYETSRVPGQQFRLTGAATSEGGEIRLAFRAGQSRFDLKLGTIEGKEALHGHLDNPEANRAGIDTVVFHRVTTTATETAAAAGATASNLNSWLLGSWEIVTQGSYTLRTLDIESVEAVGVSDAMAKAIYRPTGRSYEVTISVRPDSSGNTEATLEFRSNSKVRLQKTNAMRMDGVQVDPNGRIWNVRLWKKGVPGAVPAHLGGFLGTWEGRWNGDCTAVRLTVKYIDASSASVLYEWDAHRFQYGERMEAGWSWHNARVTDDGKLEFRDLGGGSRTFTFALSQDGRYVEGYVSTTNCGGILMGKQK